MFHCTPVVSMAAMLAAILDFSNCPRISACYPPDMYYGTPKHVESTEKKTLSAGAGLGPKIRFGCLTIMQ